MTLANPSGVVTTSRVGNDQFLYSRATRPSLVARGICGSALKHDCACADEEPALEGCMGPARERESSARAQQAAATPLTRRTGRGAVSSQPASLARLVHPARGQLGRVVRVLQVRQTLATRLKSLGHRRVQPHPPSSAAGGGGQGVGRSSDRRSLATWCARKRWQGALFAPWLRERAHDPAGTSTCEGPRSRVRGPLLAL